MSDKTKMQELHDTVSGFHIPFGVKLKIKAMLEEAKLEGMKTIALKQK